MRNTQVSVWEIKYTLSVSGYSGTAGDSLAYHNGHKFSKKMMLNLHKTVPRCTKVPGGIMVATLQTSMASIYHGGPHSSNADGVNWRTWRGYDYSLKFTEMKLREN